MRTRIKICCISSLKEADMAIRAGADAIGLVGPMPSGPGIISQDLIRAISASAPPPIARFLLSSETEADRIIEQYHQAAVDTIQLVHAVSRDTYKTVKKTLPAVRIVQVIHVLSEDDIRRSQDIASYADAILLDSGAPDKKTPELGGTGRTHNWNISREICRKVAVPVFLAGGLCPENIQQAIEYVHPFAVDICSGVRTENKLDPHKLAALILAVKRSDTKK